MYVRMRPIYSGTAGPIWLNILLAPSWLEEVNKKVSGQGKVLDENQKNGF